MKIITIPPKGTFRVNSYLVVSDSGNAVLIDCPWQPEYILEKINKSGATLKKILITHGHCDHIQSLAEVSEKTGAEVYIHELDAPKLTDSHGNLSDYFKRCLSEPVKHYDKAITVKDGDIIKQDELEFKVMHTPGHTSGGVCYIIDDVMFSGDTIFRRNIGRTDMFDGDSDVYTKTLKKLSEIPNNYRILPGHDRETTLDDEKKNIPYYL
ncbi:hypothetical protein M9Y10_019768 [Tritrichomonas musculus]|uniref:Metallo-beta-lactamase domain-containing protein n=1 Tax=Tritrichomonas musculus TaxID=1915356 RepID=A0ABR2HH76_9EUKA